MWRLVASKDPRIAAAAPFYGSLPDGADLTAAWPALAGGQRQSRAAPTW
jgi:hypothetical protein